MGTKSSAAEQRHMVDRLLLRPSEVVEATGLGKSKVYAMIETGDLPAVRFGRSVRVRADALADWIDAHAIPTDTDR